MPRALRVAAAAATACALFAMGPAALAGAPSPIATPSAVRAPDAIGGAALASPNTVYTPTPGLPAPPTVSASAWIVTDVTTGDVLAAHDSHGRFAPASALKVLTALTLIPKLDLTKSVTATSGQVNVDGTRVGVVPNHAYTEGMLLLGMLVVSGNDAARVLAGQFGGEATTAAAMNVVAAGLQADDTHAVNVDGLPAAGQTSSAYDLALIARAALALPAFRTAVATRTAEFSGQGVPAFAIQTHNPLLGVYPGLYGVKNGYTTAALASYIGAAQRGSDNIMVTLIHATPAFAPDATALLNWGFAVDHKIAPVGTLVGPVTADAVTAAASKSVGPDPAAGGVSLHGLRHLHGTSPLLWLGIGIVIGLVLVVVGRQRALRRRRQFGGRRRRMTLPPL